MFEKKFFLKNKTFSSNDILNNIDELSNKMCIKIKCDYQLSNSCKNEYFCSGRTIKQTLFNNNEKIICLYCSRYLKFSGRNNPNTKYAKLDDNFFKKIDNSAKAYLLGWIASDGHISKGGFAIKINVRDLECLYKIKDIIDENAKIKIDKKNEFCSFNIFSKQISKDLCNLLKIKPGKKSHTLEMPVLMNEELQWSFIRGYFDGDGSINTPGVYKNQPVATITSNSNKILKEIKEFSKIKCGIYGTSLEWTSNNALDFLSKIYDDAQFKLMRKYQLYLDWSMWTPSLIGFGNYGKGVSFKWNKTRKDAVPPNKNGFASNSGYDLTLLEKIKTLGEVEFYDTGIKIQPDYGIYFDLVPRSSISKSGYILANSFGVIDRNYLGNVLVPLIKYDKTMPDLKLPCRLVQIIPRQIIHLQMIEVSEHEFEETGRGDKGFGSSNG